MNSASKSLARAARRLRDDLSTMVFGEPVTHVYNPLHYAWKPHRAYLDRASGDVEVVFLGMNPGPWGMAQTGVPFGEIAAVRDWMGIEASVDCPDAVHPKRPIEGFECQRSEVSGRRLWGFFADRFEHADAFFRHHFVANYCPLVFMEASGRNRTPDKLPAAERGPLDAACDRHLATLLQTLRPSHVVGVGVYAEQCLQRVLRDDVLPSTSCSRILHPSPASPAANRDWAGKATEQLIAAGVWSAA